MSEISVQARCLVFQRHLKSSQRSQRIKEWIAVHSLLAMSKSSRKPSVRGEHLVQDIVTELQGQTPMPKKQEAIRFIITKFRAAYSGTHRVQRQTLYKMVRSVIVELAKTSLASLDLRTADIRPHVVSCLK